ncbi:MAG: hypothetical protein CM15mP120_00530 [Pseudomonadota bacterium]|nr:MAG: hypothetical protein CM15mP120_00530 [Pseudomonadota bacterium]
MESRRGLHGLLNPVGGLGWEDKVQQGTTVDFIGVELQSDDPVALANHWANVTDLSIDANAADPAVNSTMRRCVSSPPQMVGFRIRRFRHRVNDRQSILQEAKNEIVM